MGTIEFNMVYWEKEVGGKLSKEHIKIEDMCTTSWALVNGGL